MKKRLKKLVYPLFKVYLFVAGKLLLRKRIISPAGEINLSYANMITKRGTLIHGGKVKLLYLSQAYPEQKSRFNILYLTSSAMPRLAKEWINACRKAKVRIVWNQNGVGYSGWAGGHYKSINARMREIMREADWVIYQSEFCKLSAEKFLGEFEGPKSVIHNCVDTSFFAPVAQPPPPKPIRLLMAGTRDERYRVIGAIETMAVLQKMKIDAVLNIACSLRWPGAGKEVAKKIDLLGLKKRVVISGHYLQKDAPHIYQNAHILLHIKYKDPCPMTVIEAMSCGVPVIGSMSGGVPELVGAEGGVTLKVPESWETLYAPEPEAIAEAVIRIAKDWVNWSKSARNRALANFNKEKWLLAHREIFNKLIINEQR